MDVKMIYGKSNQFVCVNGILLIWIGLFRLLGAQVGKRLE